MCLRRKELLLLPQPCNGLFSRTTGVSRYQKGRTSLELNEARDDRLLGWQWHQLDHMQTICTSLQIDNHTNTSSLNFYRSVALAEAQPTVSKHWRQESVKEICKNDRSSHKPKWWKHANIATQWKYACLTWSRIKRTDNFQPVSQIFRDTHWHAVKCWHCEGEWRED